MWGRFRRISMSRKRYEELLKKETTLEFITKLVEQDIYMSTLKKLLIEDDKEDEKIESNA